jgi:hypothetical protein
MCVVLTDLPNNYSTCFYITMTITWVLVDAAIGRVSVPYCPGSRHGCDFGGKHKTLGDRQKSSKI